MRPESPAPLLEVDDLWKRYPGGPQALAGVGLRVLPGERVILLGRNGAGKTTLIRCVLGLVVPDAGRVRVAGVDVGRHPEAARRLVGVVFEEADNSYAYLTVLENVCYFGLLNGWAAARARGEALRRLAQVGLTDRAADLAQALSRGLRQKLALAVALTKDAPLLLLDEPTLGLDIEAQHALRRFLRDDMPADRGLLIATHDAAFAYAVGTRFVILHGGRIVWEGTRDTVQGPAALESRFLDAVRRTVPVPRDVGRTPAPTRVPRGAPPSSPPHGGGRPGLGEPPCPAAPPPPARPTTLATASPTPGLGHVLRAALLKKTAEYRRYWLDFAVGLAIKCIFFLGALFAVPDAPPRETALRVVGFGLWYLWAHVLAKMGNLVLEEVYQGTAEQVLVTRSRPVLLLAGTIAAEGLFSAIWVASFLVVAAALIGPTDLARGMQGLLGPALLLVPAGMAGMVGMGLAALGLSLRFKQVGSLTEVLLYYLLVFSGFFLPPGAMPAVLEGLNGLSPLARVVDGIRASWHGASPWLAGAGAWAVAVAWIVVGAWVLRTQWAWARRAGRVGSPV